MAGHHAAQAADDDQFINPRADRLETDRLAGLVLGADRHGGAIWVESEGHNPKKFYGSAFYVLIPLLPPIDLTETT